MSFATRITQATEHELVVIDALREREWIAERFGQGQLPETVRATLRRIQTPVRWMPDIIAMKSFPTGPQLRFVDAKAGDKWRETGNHDLEVAAIDAAEAFYAYAKWPVYFVFSDMSVVAPEDVREVAVPGTWRGNGSGTPFLLFPTAVGRPLDAVFGPICRDREVPA
jgi:hypothetical protein